MNHIAIMDKKLGLIEAIVSGEKTIESRWYKNKIAPWDRIKTGDYIWFKYSGRLIVAKAKVEGVLQIENLDEIKFKNLVEQYGDSISLMERNYTGYYKGKKFVVLVFLSEAKYIKRPFNIDKSGFGTGCAWLCIEDIRKIKK